LDGGDVGIDEDRVVTLLPQRLEGLRTGVVELTGLSDLERARAQDQHTRRAQQPRLRRPLHGTTPWRCRADAERSSPMIRTKSSNRWPVSWGPAAASGWNCTDRNGR